MMAVMIFVAFATGVIAERVSDRGEEPTPTTRFNIPRIFNLSDGDVHAYRLFIGDNAVILSEERGELSIESNRGSSVRINGNLNVTGNIQVQGCIMYNMSGVAQTLGDCI